MEFSGTWPSWCELNVFGESGFGLSVTLDGGKMEAPDGCPAGGKVRFPGCDTGEVDALEPPWLAVGGNSPPGEGRLVAMGGYVLGWRGW